MLDYLKPSQYQKSEKFQLCQDVNSIKSFYISFQTFFYASIEIYPPSLVELQSTQLFSNSVFFPQLGIVSCLIIDIYLIFKNLLQNNSY